MSYRRKIRGGENFTRDLGYRTWQVVLCDGTPSGDPIVPHNGTFPMGTYESIVDEVSPKYRLQMNNCAHTRETCQVFPYEGIVWTGSATTKALVLNYQPLSGWFGAPRRASDSKPTAANLEAFNAEAFEAMKPSLEGDVSVTNFLLELRDIKQLLHLCTRWQGLLKKGAETHLSWEFGIKPFFADVRKLHKKLMKWRDKIADFRSMQNQTLRAHYRKKVEDESQAPGFVTGTPIDTWRVYKTTTYFYATMFYTYKIVDEEKLDTIWGEMNALRDMIGLRFTADVIWEAIPFSFVVDWFLKVGRFLEQFKEPLIDTVVTVVDYCITYKVLGTEEGWAEYQGDCGSAAVQHRHYLNTTKCYVRQRCLPNAGIYFTNQVTYSGRQQALSASLLMMRRR